MPHRDPPVRYEFGPFRLDPAEHRLEQEGVPIALTPKVFDTLMALVDRPGELVTRGELLDRVWPGTFIEEGVLTRNISVLRKALGDRDQDQRYIQTVPKRGYRFVAPVRCVTNQLVAPEAQVFAADAGVPTNVAAGGSGRVRRLWLALPFAAVVVALVGLDRPSSRDVHGAMTRVSEPNRAAYEAYLRGRHHWNKRTPDGIAQARVFFAEAIDRDPAYAAAHAGLADCFALLSVYGSIPAHEGFPRARAAALRAIEIDASLAEAHASLGFTRFAYDWDLAGGERDLRRAIELSPTYATAYQWLGTLLASRGRASEALEMLARAEQLDPLSEQIAKDAGGIAALFGLDKDALARARRLERIDSGSLPALSIRGAAHFASGRFTEAAAVYEQLSAVRPGLFRFRLAAAQARAGNTARARAVLSGPDHDDLNEGLLNFERSLAYASLGEHDRALGFLEAAANDRSIAVTWIKVSPWFDPLRREPRFGALLERIHLD